MKEVYSNILRLIFINEDKFKSFFFIDGRKTEFRLFSIG